MHLHNMIWQGSDLGPPLWNTFYADVRIPVLDSECTDIIFADDLNTFQGSPRNTKNGDIQECMRKCQEQVHTLGTSNMVEFDGAKEHFIILDHWGSFGTDFKLLGAIFDTRLLMTSHCDKVAQVCCWKVHTLIRQRFALGKDNAWQIFKAHVLPVLEASTPAIYHASNTVLNKIDAVHGRFVHGMESSREQ